MSFLYPAFLIGALAIAVPIALHLLRREVAPDVPFPAVRLLQTSAVEQSRRRRLRDILLLAARVAALLLLAISFARPYVRAAAPAAVRVVAIDRSYSMAGEDRFDSARQIAASAIESAGRGQRVVLIAFDSRADVVAGSGDPSEALAALRSLQPGTRGTRYGAMFSKAQEVADGADGELIVVTDLQQSGWDERVPASLPEGWRVEVKDIPAAAANVGVVALATTDREALATVRNTGAASRTGRITVRAGGKDIASSAYSLAPGATAQLPIPLRGPQQGPLSVSVEDPGGLPADDVRYAIAGGQQADRALVVAGKGQNGLYLSRALQAPAGADGHLDVDVADGAAVSAMTADQLRRYRVIALLSTRSVERRSWDTIAAHVSAGAGLFVGAGTDVDPSVVASLAAWQPALAIAEEPAAQLTLAPTDPRHPIFQPFGALATNLGQASVTRAWRVAPDGWSVIARFSNGMPALLERPLERGRVVLFASDVDRRWNDLPLHPSFVPFALETIRYAAGGGSALREYVSGEEPAGIGPGPGVFSGADGRRIVVNVDPGEGDLRRMTADAFGQAVGRTAAASTPAEQRAERTEAHQGYWQYGLLVMLAALVAESFVGRS